MGRRVFKSTPITERIVLIAEMPTAPPRTAASEGSLILVMLGVIFAQTGFFAALPIGPVNLLVIRRTLAYGTIFGLIAGLGAAFADGIFAAVIGFGATARGAVTALNAHGVHDVHVLTQRGLAAVASPIHSATMVHFDQGDSDPRRSIAFVGDAKVPLAGFLGQVTRDEFEKVLDQPFVTSARARGMGDLAVRFKHVLRHSVLPAITLSGWALGALISGAVIVENVFARPGIGNMIVGAAEHRDVPLVSGVVMLVAFIYVVANILVDIAYAIVDPRLRG